jgi:hypothetical protein
MFSRAVALFLALVSLASAGPAPLNTNHVLYITTYGLRGLLFFRGP